jgi:hypothetical protein
MYLRVSWDHLGQKAKCTARVWQTLNTKKTFVGHKNPLCLKKVMAEWVFVSEHHPPAFSRSDRRSS